MDFTKRTRVLQHDTSENLFEILEWKNERTIEWTEAMNWTHTAKLSLYHCIRLFPIQLLLCYKTHSHNVIIFCLRISDNQKRPCFSFSTHTHTACAAEYSQMCALFGRLVFCCPERIQDSESKSNFLILNRINTVGNVYLFVRHKRVMGYIHFNGRPMILQR